MIGLKPGAAGAKHSCGQSTKRKRDRDTKRDPGGVSGGSGSGDGGSGVSGEWDGVADGKFFGVRESSTVVEIKKYVKGYNLYTTVKEGMLVAAIIYDVFRVYLDPSYPEAGLNIPKVGLCIQKKAQTKRRPIGKPFLDEFKEQHPLKLDELPDEQFPLNLENLTKEQFVVLKEQLIKLGHQCFLELNKEIIGDHIQGRQRMDVDIIPPYLPEDNVPQVDDHTQAVKDQLADVVAAFAPSNGKLDAKGEADKSALITFLEVQLEKLKPAQKEGSKDLAGLKDGELFINPYVPQV